MKVLQILFITLTFSLLQVMVLQGTTAGANIEFPELGLPPFETKAPRDCDSFGSCVGYVGDIFFNIGIAFTNGVLFVFNLAKFIIELFGLIISLAVTGIDGAPFYVNVLFTAPLTVGTSLIMYKLLRGARSSS